MKFSFPPRATLAAAPRRAGAFSLVVTLIIVSMLAVVAIGFLSSMSSERVTADAFGNKTRAEQAAQAGVDSAIAILRQAFKDFPDSATVWENHSKNTDGTGQVAPYNEGTSLYLRAMPAGNNSDLPDPAADNSPNHLVTTPPNVGTDARSLFVLPLISGAQYKAISSPLYSTWVKPEIKPQVDPKVTDLEKLVPTNTGYVNLNVLRYKGDTQGWLGSPIPDNNTVRTTPRTTRVPWVEIRQADTANSTSAPVVARYAFWVEDESFRANINYAGLGNSPDNTTRDRRDNAATAQPSGSPSAPADQPVDAATVDLFGFFRALGNPPEQAVSAASALSTTRQIYPGGLFSEGLGFSHTSGLTNSLADQLRFLATTTSSGLNLSRHGSQRVNLNELEYPKNAPSGTTPDPQGVIDAIVKTIQYHAPNFGQRFYRIVGDARVPDAVSNSLNLLSVPNTGEPNQNLIYLWKLATNIHDYMDKDLKPTMVDGIKDTVSGKYNPVVHKGTYPAPSNPALPIYPAPNPDGGNIIWAQGKDSAPFIDECAVRYHLGPLTTATTYELDMDYYIEVWNPSTRDVVATELGPNPRIRVIDPPPWQAASSSSSANTTTFASLDDPAHPELVTPSSASPLRDYDIDIKDVTFPAGKATVITTDHSFSANNVATTAAAYNNFHWCPFYKNIGTNIFTGPMPAGGRKYLAMVGRSVSTHTSDYLAEVALYTDDGYIDFAPGCLPIYSGVSTTLLYLSKTPAHESTTGILYGGSLRGNGGFTGTSTSESSITGDPRTNNEQLKTDPAYQGGTAVNQPRYYNFGLGNATANPPIPPGTLGVPNTDYTQPTNNSGPFTAWPDYYTFASNATLTGSDSISTKEAQGQALTFIANSQLTSIGQLGDVYDPARYTGSGLLSSRGGGRSLRIGQPDDLWDGDSKSASRTWTAWRLADFFCISDAMLQPGLININGVARDNGAALRAALTGFKFQSKAPDGRGAPNLERNPLVVDAGATGATATQGLDTLITQIRKRLAPDSSATTTGTVGYTPYNTGQGPFFERGEFSELPAFGRTLISPSTPTASYTGTDLVNGATMNQTFDRGREEVFRRTAEMITTRGNVFTVYAMGQALSPVGKVTSTQRLKVTFRLNPKKAGGTGGAAAPDFHPATGIGPSGVENPLPFDTNPVTRFAKPDHYDIEILSASKGGG